MRERKYRAWYKAKSKMISWSDIKDYYNFLAMLDPSYVDYELYEVMEYTGLEDGNGVEIYEGDICKLSNDTYYSNEYFNTLDEWEMVMEVIKEDYSFKFRDVTDKYASIFLFEADQGGMDIEVIGNVYENLELLKGEEDLAF